MNIFDGLKDVNDIKSTYRRYAFIFHPDVGGTTGQMQELNDVYHKALRQCTGYTSTDEKGAEHTYYYDHATEQEIIEKIYSLIGLKMEDVKILLVGKWIWLTGETRQYRQALKELKCRWHNKRKMWYWHGKGYSRTFSSNKTFRHICDCYGVRQYDDRVTVPATV